MPIIFGVDTDRPVTPLQALDALVFCFTDAHCADSGLPTGAMAKKYCTRIVQSAFEKTGGDFDHPTKQSIGKVIAYLADFSSGFRNPDVIRKHREMMMTIISAIPGE